MKSFGEYIQLIQEVGNRPYKWKKEPSGGQAGSVWEAVFVTNNKQKYYFIANRIGREWEVAFEAHDSFDSSGSSDSFGITGTQGAGAIRVFSTVAEILEAFVKDIKPNMFSFTADKPEGKSSDGSRTKVYSRFAKLFAKKTKYTMQEIDGREAVEFLFRKKKKKK